MQIGAFRFVLLSIISLVGSHALYCILAFNFDYSSIQTCAVGFSAVLFSYKVVVNWNSDSVGSVGGFPMPNKWIAWFELFYISFLFPSASFLGHLCGILIGTLYCLGVFELIFLLERFLPDTRSIRKCHF